MRLLFVSSTTEGGSGRSQRELARRLIASGYGVTSLVDDPSPARWRRLTYEQLSDLAVRLGQGRVAEIVRMLEARPGRRPRCTEIDGIVHLVSPIPENAFGPVVEAVNPNIVVANSLVRLSWRRIRAACSERGIPTVLYIREEESLDHLAVGELPDAIVANAESLRAAVRRRGFECAFIPSIVDVDDTRTVSTRRVVLVINAVQSRGIDIVWRVAGALPEIPFVVQESWSLKPRELAVVEQRAACLPNVEFRRAAVPGPGLYGDARLLMVPYRVDNRPRVIAEAQANGVPIVAADLPALREAVGEGGLHVALEDVAGWSQSIRMLWSDDDAYDRLVAAAFRRGKQSELDSAAAGAAFEEFLMRLATPSSR